MTEHSDQLKCQAGCWGLGAVAGFAATAIMIVLGDVSATGSIFVGIVTVLAVGLFLSLVLCTALSGPAVAPTVPKRAAAPAPRPASTAPAASAAPAASPAPAAPAPTPEPAPAPAPTSTPAPAAEAEAEAPAAGDAAKPATLSAARDGGPDDLKLIKGVGPKLESLLHSMGFYHFDQVAGWTASEVAWVDENLEGFKGRVTRDGWVSQAKILAAGGETEFSAKSK